MFGRRLFFVIFFGSSLSFAAIRPLSIFQPVSQKDTLLKDLFSSNRKSELCGPIVLANILKQQKTRYSKLAIRGSTEDLVRKLFVSCRTQRDGGTRMTHLKSCAEDFYKSSGYPNPLVKIVGPDPFFNPGQEHLVKKLSFADVKQNIDRGYSVILEVGWYALDAVTKSWRQVGGHYVWVIGYSDHKLRVVNPEVDYSKAAKPYDEVAWIVQANDPNTLNPSGSDFFLRGPGFDRKSTRAFAKYLVVANPEL